MDPITNPQAYDTCKIDGVECPGIIAAGGVTGFKREANWEVKKGKGTKGATTTIDGLPPTKGSIKFLLWTKAHFDAWDGDFRARLKFDPTKKKKNAVDLYHPSTVKNECRAVVTEGIGIETPEGNGLWSITVEFLEFMPEAPKPATATPDGSKKDTTKGGTTGTPPDPIADAQQKEIERLLKEAQAP